MSLSLDAIRNCLEGNVPSLVATCDAQGMPNVAYVSQVHYVDRHHVALTYQFFNKTRANILANPQATAYVADSDTGARYTLALQYLRTEDSGPLFESMKAKLAGIASHTGMTGVFRLLGADVYRVLAFERLPGPELPAPQPRCNPMSAVRQIAQRLAAAPDLRALLDDALAALEEHMGIGHSMVLLMEHGTRAAPRLFTVATRGYPASGVGSEIPLGQGVIGVAAQHNTPIRISHFTAEYTYNRTVRDQWLAQGRAQGQPDPIESEIPLPGLEQPHSQLAAPIVLGRRVVGVLYVESPEAVRFSHDDEDALMAVATQLGATISALQSAADSEEPTAPSPAPAAAAPQPSERAVLVRRYRVNDSVFIDDDYLIKGVAGAIFWRLASDVVAGRRAEFTNRELRLDPTLRLPDLADNLEARLILLQRRLAERCPFIAIEKTGRGRFRVRADRPLKLIEAG